MTESQKHPSGICAATIIGLCEKFHNGTTTDPWKTGAEILDRFLAKAGKEITIGGLPVIEAFKEAGNQTFGDDHSFLVSQLLNEIEWSESGHCAIVPVNSKSSAIRRTKRSATSS